MLSPELLINSCHGTLASAFTIFRAVLRVNNSLIRHIWLLLLGHATHYCECTCVCVILVGYNTLDVLFYMQVC